MTIINKLLLSGFVFGYVLLFVNPVLADPPFAHTIPATAITLRSANISGMASPNGLSTRVWLEWGATTAYGTKTAAVDIGNGYDVTTVTNLVSGLTAALTYHFRVVASNSEGIVYGRDQRFGMGKKIWAFGANGSGQCNVPSKLTNVVAVAAGNAHGLALKPDASDYGWGNNSYKQSTNFMFGTNAGFAAFLQQIQAGESISAGLKTDTTVWVWGDTFGGVTNVPAGLSNVVMISVGCDSSHVLGLKSDGRVVAWGSNAFGQTNVPSTLSNVVAVAAGMSHSLALRADGTLVAWGYDQYGQAEVPPNLTGIVDIAAGAFHNLALRSDGTVIAWGDNSYGQTNIPPGLNHIVAIASGGRNNLALKNDGTVVCWGDNSYNQTSIPAGATNVLAMSVGSGFNLLLSADTPPVTSDLTYSVNPNNDVFITLPANDPDNDPLAVTILSPPNNGVLLQYTGSAIISTNNTPVTDPAHRVIFAPSGNSAGLPYASFRFAVNDGWVTLTNTVTINILPPVLRIDSYTRNQSGQVELRFQSTSNLTYKVWASTDLHSWMSVGATTESAPGMFDFWDYAGSNYATRFYQVRWP